jgi:hypothetical protein
MTQEDDEESGETVTLHLTVPYYMIVKDVPVSAIEDDDVDVHEYHALGSIAEYAPAGDWEVDAIERDSSQSDDFPPACIECGSSDTGLVAGHPDDPPAVKCNECGVVFE